MSPDRQAGVPAPNYTQVPNHVLDRLAEIKSDAELRVILAVCRKTFGWHKETDQISLSQLQAATGLSRQGAIDGSSRAVAEGWIAREPRGRSFAYRLIVNAVDQSAEADSQPTRPPMVSAVDSESLPGRPPMVSAVDLQKKAKDTNQKKPKEPLPDAAAPGETGPLVVLLESFQAAAGLTLPEATSKAEKKTVGVRWWNALRQMHQLAGQSAALELIATVKYMREQGLTISAPASCVNVFASRHGALVTGVNHDQQPTRRPGSNGAAGGQPLGRKRATHQITAAD